MADSTSAPCQIVLTLSPYAVLNIITMSETATLSRKAFYIRDREDILRELEALIANLRPAA